MGLTFLFVGCLYVPHTSPFANPPLTPPRRGILSQSRRLRYIEPFVPALYIYGILSFLLAYVLAGVYFDMSFDDNFDYYLCALSLLGLVLLYLLKDFQGESFLKNLEFAAVLMIIAPLMLSSFIDWTSYMFFMLLTFIVGLIFLIYGWYIEDKI